MRIFKHLSVISLCNIRATVRRFSPLADYEYARRSPTCQIAPYMPNTEAESFGPYIKSISFTNFSDESTRSINDFLDIQRQYLPNLIEAEFINCTFTVDSDPIGNLNDSFVSPVEKLTIEKCKIVDDSFFHLPIGVNLLHLDVMHAERIMDISGYIHLIPNVKALMITLCEDYNIFHLILAKLVHLEHLYISMKQLLAFEYFEDNLDQLSKLKIFEYDFALYSELFHVLHDIENTPDEHLRIVPEYRRILYEYLDSEVD